MKNKFFTRQVCDCALQSKNVSCLRKLALCAKSSAEMRKIMRCGKCGSELDESGSFCPHCGARYDAGTTAEKKSASEMLQRLKQRLNLQKQSDTRDAQSFQTVAIAVGAAAVLLVAVGAAAFLVVRGVRTSQFNGQIAAFEEVQTEVGGLGKYESDYYALLDEAGSAASRYALSKYEDIAARMESLADEIVIMNEKVAEYREQYESIVNEIETNGLYVMDDYEAEYQNIKSSLEQALSDFDESGAKAGAADFADIRDNIIAGNEAMASSYMSDADNIQTSFKGYSTHAFELYMISDFVDKLQADLDGRDYIKLDDDYAQLKEWSDKFYISEQSADQIVSYVQADVSDDNVVKLYLGTNNYDEYDFNLSDFIIYERNGNTWTECEPIGISQIKGSLTMDLVADISSSMSGNFYTMQCAVEGFVNSTYSDTALGLSTIGSIYERYQDFTTDKSSIINSAWDLECYGRTSLYQSLYSSVIYTASAEGARCVVAFTDGINEPYGTGYDYDAQDVIDASLLYQVPVYIIGIGSYVNSSELRYIAEATGGAYYNNVSIYNLQNIYESIYEEQGKLYQLSYQTTVANNVNRDVYVLYADNSYNLSIRLEDELDAEALQEAYESASLSADDLVSFYTDSKYLSSDDLSKLGDDLEAVQTIINIYYAKNGFEFGDGENGQKQLDKMISLGVISENGTLEGDDVTLIIKDNPVLYQNFKALYNYRYELIYAAAYEIYTDNPTISYEELRDQVHEYYGEENKTRFAPVTQAAWNALNAV